MNYHLFLLINGPAGRLDALDDTMEFAATRLIYLIFSAAAVLIGVTLHRRDLVPVIRLGVVLLLSYAAATMLSHLSGQTRPFQSHQVHQLIPHEPGVSLPSDHATAAFALAFGVYAFLDRRWGIALSVAGLAVGVARIWTGVHYPGDIAAAAVIAALATLSVSLSGRHPSVGIIRSDRI